MTQFSSEPQEIQAAHVKAARATMQIAVGFLNVVKDYSGNTSEFYGVAAGNLVKIFEQPYSTNGRPDVTCRVNSFVAPLEDGHLGTHEEFYYPEEYIFESDLTIAQSLKSGQSITSVFHRVAVEEGLEALCARQAFLGRVSENKDSTPEQDVTYLEVYNPASDGKIKMMREIAAACLRAALWEKVGKDMLPQATVEYINSASFHVPTAGAIIVANVSESLGASAAVLSKIDRYLTISSLKDIKVFEKNIIAKPFQEPLRILLGDGYEEIHPKNKGKQMRQEEKSAVKGALQDLATEVPAERVEQISAFLQQRGLITR